MNYHLPKSTKCDLEHCGFYFVKKHDPSVFYCFNPHISGRKFDKHRRSGTRCHWSIACLDFHRSHSESYDDTHGVENIRPAEEYLDLYLKISSKENTLAIALKTSLALASLYFTVFYGLPAGKDILNNFLTSIGVNQ